MAMAATGLWDSHSADAALLAVRSRAWEESAFEASPLTGSAGSRSDQSSRSQIASCPWPGVSVA